MKHSLLLFDLQAKYYAMFNKRIENIAKSTELPKRFNEESIRVCCCPYCNNKIEYNEYVYPLNKDTQSAYIKESCVNKLLKHYEEETKQKVFLSDDAE